MHHRGLFKPLRSLRPSAYKKLHLLGIKGSITDSKDLSHYILRQSGGKGNVGRSALVESHKTRLNSRLVLVSYVKYEASAEYTNIYSDKS